MTAKEKANNLVGYFWTEVEDFKKHKTIKMTKQMAKDCAIQVSEEIKEEIEKYGITGGITQTRKKYWDEVISEIRNIESLYSHIK